MVAVITSCCYDCQYSLSVDCVHVGDLIVLVVGIVLENRETVNL